MQTKKFFRKYFCGVTRKEKLYLIFCTKLLFGCQIRGIIKKGMKKESEITRAHISTKGGDTMPTKRKKAAKRPARKAAPKKKAAPKRKPAAKKKAAAKRKPAKRKAARRK